MSGFNGRTDAVLEEESQPVIAHRSYRLVVAALVAGAALFVGAPANADAQSDYETGYALGSKAYE